MDGAEGAEVKGSGVSAFARITQELHSHETRAPHIYRAPSYVSYIALPCFDPYL